MKYISEFRDGELARRLARKIAAASRPERSYRLMEFCGGHTHAISRYGLGDLLPANVRMIHGPGCPVCVLPIGRIDQAIRLALEQRVILCTYADTMRVPASAAMSLFEARALGADVRILYSVDDALTIAEQHPDRAVVFMAIGFETTTPPTAVAIKETARRRLTNLSFLCYHVLTTAAMRAIVDAPNVAIDGFVGPAHVSTVIGSAPYREFAERYGKPVVIAGFEPLDVMQAILMLIEQINDGCARVDNEFTRAVSEHGNLKAQQLCAEVFGLREQFDWRGLGSLPASALTLAADWQGYDAERRFDIPYVAVREHPGCECPAILRGEKTPSDCKLFAKACTPEQPIGSCMVSSEGACAAQYTYGRRQTPNQRRVA